MKKLALIMLAAGNSRRFGSNKLLYPVEGIPMYQRILDKLVNAEEKLKKEKPDLCVKITVVTQYEKIAEEAEKRGAAVLFNPHPDEGISSSIRIGVMGNRDADACLFTVSDQPWIEEETILALIRLFLSGGKGMACVSFQGKLGNPCIFSSRNFGELSSLTGESGGKAVLRLHRKDAEVLKVRDGRELVDVDQPDRMVWQ